MPVDKVCLIIVEAREFQAKLAPVEPDPGSNQSERGFREVLEDYPDGPAGRQVGMALARSE